jgi:hypothetical protein
MFQISIEHDKDIDYDSMKQRNSFFFENNSAIFWKSKLILLNFESRSSSKKSSYFINETINRLLNW